DDAPDLCAAMIEGGADAVGSLLARMAARAGRIVQVQSLAPARRAAGEDYALNWLVEERAVSTNTAAAGGNASLMSLG
ncbi:MAG: hypothetical protein KGQ28_09340, partial [Hyphomicrobiales bacterium]|nr:hypothetical protein [Hyphomicrobiales bacterium]